MDALLIRGGVPLRGEVVASGAKNAVLPILAATLLTSETCTIRRVPNLSDVRFMGEILESLGAEVKFEGDHVTVRAEKIRG
ncbi:MAG: UDP-N-acetylglucosamine 1-carboxyvinyltransferase, partial [Verrucomicrobiota bacterium]